MEANCPPQVASASVEPSAHGEGLATAVLDRIGQLVCGLHGHDQVLQFGDSRMYLHCLSCGHESPGWQMPERTPILKFGGSRRPEVETASNRIRRVA
jgi:hypothetical protein